MKIVAHYLNLSEIIIVYLDFFSHFKNLVNVKAPITKTKLKPLTKSCINRNFIDTIK